MTGTLKTTEFDAVAAMFEPVAADGRFAADGRVRHLAAYDAGQPAAPRPDGGPGVDAGGRR